MTQFSTLQENFGTLVNGAVASKITLRQESPDARQQFSAVVTNFGGRLLAFTGPDRNSVAANIIRGPQTLAECLADTTYAGAIIGRYANRIAGATFELNGVTHSLVANAVGNTLHGGASGFDRALLQVVATGDETDCAFVELGHCSEHGDQGFPGTLDVRARYTLFAGGRLEVRLTATTDQTTVVSLTTHPYFNLLGTPENTAQPEPGTSEESCLRHILQLPASTFLPISAHGIPAGNPCPVLETPFDFRQPNAVANYISSTHDQLACGQGFDHYFLVDAAWPTPREPVLHATLQEFTRGRQLQIHSTLPGLQFYSGNFLGMDAADDSQSNDPESETGDDPVSNTRNGTWNGASPTYREALCLEPQFPPDAPNRPDFPSTRLAPGDEWQHRIVYLLGIMP